MTVEEFKAQAIECNYTVNCDSVEQWEVDYVESLINSLTGKTPCNCTCNCCCDDKCAIVYGVYVRKEVAPEVGEVEFRVMLEQYLLAKGCLSYGY